MNTATPSTPQSATHILLRFTHNDTRITPVAAFTTNEDAYRIKRHNETLIRALQNHQNKFTHDSAQARPAELHAEFKALQARLHTDPHNHLDLNCADLLNTNFTVLSIPITTLQGAQQ